MTPRNEVAALSLVLAFLYPPLGIALGAIARSDLDPGDRRTRGLTTAAIVIGCGLTALAISLAVLSIVLSVVAASFFPYGVR